ncbi:MAG: DegT/DnrJ/EryC1/StrS family aminotransferase [Candidatus Riflebacteria bacterium]|nr:DegT/DnrJ/EryC1/StrS family aminotransferase [Candidatus Riflebacteria bacterium]
MVVKFLDLQKQYLSIKEEIDSSIFQVINSSSYVGGKFVSEFEKNFADFLGSNNYCIGLGNGTDAIEIALWSLDLPPESEVIVPANTFIATSEAVTTSGLKVIFADCEEDYNVSASTIEKQITDKTRVIIVVHLYGQPAKMDEIIALLQKYPEIKLIEDCSQAHGAGFRGQRVGTFGALATFSFYPGKNLGAYGDAGCVVTKDKNLAEKIVMYANHGRSSHYTHEIEGRNSRLDGIQAAILNVKLRHLHKWLEIRNNLAEAYLAGLKDTSIILPKVSEDKFHSWHLFVIRHPKRDQLKEFLGKMDIHTGIHYPVALPNLHAYRNHGQNCKDFLASRIDCELLSLPIGEHLSIEDVYLVVDRIKKFPDL